MKISYSQMSTYLACGIRYQKRYIERIPHLSTPTLVAGKAVHAGIEMNYRQKVTSKVDLPVSDLQDCVADHIEKGFQEELFLMEDEKTVGKEKLRGEWKDLAVKGIEVYHREVSPQVFPACVEHEFTVPLWDGHELWGFIDVVDEKGIIRDTKTARRTPASTVADTSEQLTVYTLAYRSLFGGFPERLVLDFVILSDRPSSKMYVTHRTPDHMRAFIRRLARVMSGIEAGVFLPPAEPWQCLYCQYRDRCEEKLI